MLVRFLNLYKIDIRKMKISIVKIFYVFNKNIKISKYE